MKASAGFFILVISLIGGGLTTPAFSFISSYQPIQIKMTLPQNAIDFSDLDVRDQLNRRVKSRSAVRSLERLFTSNLNHMLMMNLTPTKQALWEFMSKAIMGFASWFINPIKSLFEKFSVWISSKKLKKLLMSIHHLKMKHPSGDEQRSFMNNPRSSFQFLVTDILSSTQLLR